MNSQIDINPPSFWQTVFEQSYHNGAPYDGDSLPPQYFPFPDKPSWFKRRLEFVRHGRQSCLET